MKRDRFSRPLCVLALMLIVGGVLMPTAWYDAVPQNSDFPPPPIKGVRLLQAMFILEGLALSLLLRRRWTFEPVPASQLLGAANNSDAADPISRRTAAIAVVAITTLAFVLRIFRLDSDLWLDEIATVMTYSDMDALQVLASYVGSNNHVLNTLLMNWSVSIFGREEWAIRLPAVLFGTATIPAFYWVARLALSRTASLASALLLSVTYHHIFFSQNARGYAAYLFFGLVTTGVLYCALQRDTFRTWCLYIALLLLGFASLLNTIFVAGAHVLVCAVTVWTVSRRGGVPWPLIRRLLAVYILAGILALQLYALALPHAYVYLTNLYVKPSSGHALTSLEFVREFLRGLTTVAASSNWLVLPVLAVGAAIGLLGFFQLWQQNWFLTAALGLPPVLTGVFIVVGGLTASPRFFLNAMFPTILSAVVAVEYLIENASPRAKNPLVRAKAMAVVMLAAAGIAVIPLPHYYATPKQAYRASLGYIRAEQQPGDVVVAIHLSEAGYRYYGPQFGLNDNLHYVRSEEAFNRVLASYPRDRIFIVTTLQRILRITHPELATRIQNEWQIVQTFPATIGDGELAVWKSR